MGRAVPGRKPVVLVVEDENLIRLSALDMVEEAGFEAIAASDADEAIRILESRNDIRAVFTDVHMPGSMDGLRLARVVRNRWPPVALIVTVGRLHFHDGTAEGEVAAGEMLLINPGERHTYRADVETSAYLVFAGLPGVRSRIWSLRKRSEDRG